MLSPIAVIDNEWVTENKIIEMKNLKIWPYLIESLILMLNFTSLGGQHFMRIDGLICHVLTICTAIKGRDFQKPFHEGTHNGGNIPGFHLPGWLQQIIFSTLSSSFGPRLSAATLGLGGFSASLSGGQPPPLPPTLGAGSLQPQPPPPPATRGLLPPTETTAALSPLKARLLEAESNHSAIITAYSTNGMWFASPDPFLKPAANSKKSGKRVAQPQPGTARPRQLKARAELDAIWTLPLVAYLYLTTSAMAVQHKIPGLLKLSHHEQFLSLTWHICGLLVIGCPLMILKKLVHRRSVSLSSSSSLEKEEIKAVKKQRAVDKDINLFERAHDALSPQALPKVCLCHQLAPSICCSMWDRNLATRPNCRCHISKALTPT